MFQLIYSSFETEPFDAAALKRLLMKSRMRNTEVGITGMLVYDRGMFLQALEGEQAAVESTYRRIGLDPRHRDATVIFREPNAEARTFGQWAMGYSDATGGSKLLQGFIKLGADVRGAPLDRANAMRVLLECAKAA